MNEGIDHYGQVVEKGGQEVLGTEWGHKAEREGLLDEKRGQRPCRVILFFSLFFLFHPQLSICYGRSSERQGGRKKKTLALVRLYGKEGQGG